MHYITSRGRVRRRLGAVLALSLFVFTPDHNLWGQPKAKPVVVLQGSDLESLNPQWHNTTSNHAIWRHIIEPLAEYDFTKRRHVGVLAESWSAKGTEWVFKLRSSVKFQNGAPFTAADVVYTFKRSMDSKLSRQNQLRRLVKSIHAIDVHTVSVTTEKPLVSFLEYIDNLTILSETTAKESADEATFGGKPVGTGPFRFVEWTRGGIFVMERNPGYWGKAAQLDRVIWRSVPEAPARIAGLESGQADLIVYVPPHELERFKGNRSMRVEEARTIRTFFLVLSPAHKPLDNKLVRQAINYAIDKEALIRYVLEGKAQRLDGIVGPAAFGYDPSYKPYSYDPAKAKELLVAAGFPNGFEVDFYSPSGNYTKDKEVAQAIVGQLAKVGIKARLLTPEWGVLNEIHTGGKCPICLRGRATVIDPDNWLYDYFGTGASKRSLYSNPDFDRLLQQQQQIFDPEQREPVLQKAMKLLLEDAPIVPLYNPVDSYGVSRRLIWKPSPKDYVSLLDASLTEK
jgi:peptide/nickel transport system substrate-binding protein